MSNVIGKSIGRLPVYCGEWSNQYNQGNGYFKFNEVSYAGSLFISTVNGNTHEPCQLVRDSSGNLVSYTVGEGWKIAANALDASIAVTNAIGSIGTKTTFYLSCNSAGSSEVKTISCDGFVLDTHIFLIIKMRYANTNVSPKLNINGTGDKPIIYNGQNASGTNTWRAAEVVDVYYDGYRYYMTTHEYSEKPVLYETVNITHDELVGLRDSSLLVPGQSYRITDYQCTTTQPYTRSAGHQFDIIVTATDRDRLSEEAKAVHHIGDNYFAGCNLDKWKIKYCLDNDYERFAWAIEDVPMFSNWVMDVVYVSFTKNKYVYNNVEYIPYRIMDGFLSNYEYIAKTSDDSSVAYFAEFDESINEFSYVDDSSALFAYVYTSRVSGKGVIYEMTDEHDNCCYYDFKNIQCTDSDGIVDPGKYFYLFSNIPEEGQESEDMSMNGKARDNMILNSHFSNGGLSDSVNSNGEQSLVNFIFFKSNDSTYANLVGKNSSKCFFGNGCWQNKIERNGYRITFEDSTRRSTIGYVCHHINIKGDDNVIGNACSYIDLVSNSYRNNIGSASYYISLPKCKDCTVDSSCGYIYAGMYSDCITIGNRCHNIYFGSDASVGRVKRYYNNIYVEPQTENVVLNAANTLSLSNIFRNIVVRNVVNNVPVVYSVPGVNQTYRTVVAQAPDVVILPT